MAEIDVSCPHCGEQVKAPAEFAGKTSACPSCGKEFRIPTDVPASQPAVPRQPEPAIALSPRQSQPRTDISAVVVTDIDIPFMSMVLFMVKWAIAAIPAFIILWILALSTVAVLGAVIGGCAQMYDHSLGIELPW